MIIDANEKFKVKRALNGDKEAMCEMIDLFSEKEDWFTSLQFLELLVDNEPLFCESKFLEITGDELSYEDMLRLIAWDYYHERENGYMAFRWFQKYFDYLDFKYRNLDSAEREKIKQECSIYQFMKDNHVFDRMENRFLLKWEQELFYKKQ